MNKTKQNNKEEKTYYERLKSTGEIISALCVLLGMIMIFGVFIAMTSDGPVFMLICAIFITFLSGSAINKLFFCIAEMANNTEKQTELLEKQTELLGKLTERLENK